MSDNQGDNSTSLARRVAGGTLGRLRRLASRGKSRLATALESQLEDIGESVRDQLLELLSSRQQMERVQQALVTVSGWAMERGFRADPNAELLFDFVDWLEDRHGRDRIALLLVQSPLLQDPAFLEALAHLSQTLTPWKSDQVDRKWTADRLNSFKNKAGRRLLDLLVELAALEREQPPPAGAEARIAYFESAPIPLRFTRLAAMTRGEKLLRRPTKGRVQLAQRALSRLAPDRREPTGLIRFVPGVGDEALHFLIFSTSFFLQSYLLRNLIEALPELAEDLDRTLRDEEIIDLK